MNEVLKAPFPWFGGKSRASRLVWSRFGRVPNYVEPFAGSLAVLLQRPRPFDGTETINDIDGFVSNFWRAIRSDPESVADHAKWPVNENDLHARHSWLVGRVDDLVPRLEGDPEYFDPKIAGWWVWGIACWIGGEFCSGKGPWKVVERDGIRRLEKSEDTGRGVQRRRVQLGNAGHAVNQSYDGLYDWFDRLSDRLRRVRVCCGDWSRVCGPSPTTNLGRTAVFLDPPYADTAGRVPSIYRKDSMDVAHDVRRWAIARGDDLMFRIALCGYEGEHEMPSHWECVESKVSNGGYGKLSKGIYDNNLRERIWFSPHCLKPEMNLFDRYIPDICYAE